MDALEELSLRVGGPDLLRWHHENGAEVSESEYVGRYRALRVSGIENSQRIYLDTNYWIGIRDATMGRKNGIWCHLLYKLRELVRTRKSICLMNQWSFFELARQNGDSLRVTASLVDELCEGVAIAPADELRFFDASDFVASTLGFEYDSSIGRWTWVGQLLKSSFPPFPRGASIAGQRAMAKALTDTFYNARVSDLFAQVGWDDAKKKFGASHIDEATVVAVEARKAEQLERGASRANIRLHEFRTLIEGRYAPLFADLLAHARAGGRISVSDEYLRHLDGELVEKAVADFRGDKLGAFLPEAALGAELYTLYERDKLRKLSTRDYMDWQHAIVALPHSNLFFTESHLANQLVTQLHSDKRYACTVVGSVEHAIEALCA